MTLKLSTVFLTATLFAAPAWAADPIQDCYDEAEAAHDGIQ